MRIFLLLALALPLFATDSIYYLDLEVSVGEDDVTVTPIPESLVDYDTLKDDRFDLGREMMELTLDAPFRQTAFLFRTLERNRGAVIDPNAAESMPIMRFKIELAMRDVTGEPIDLREYDVDLLLSKEPDQGIIRSQGVSHTFAISKVKSPIEYLEFLKNVIFPTGPASFAKPNLDEFLVDVYFKWPKVLVDPDEVPIFDLFPSLILWNKGQITKVKIHLGTTYAYKEDGFWQQVASDQFRIFASAIRDYGQVLKLVEDGEEEAAIAALEEYLSISPVDKKALRLLMDLYLDFDMQSEAYNLITRFQPFYATIREGLANQRDLAQDARRKRNLLLGKRAKFKRDREVELKITSPVEDDLVTGTTNLEFVLAKTQAPILQIDCYLDEQLIASLKEPPFRVPFTVDGTQGELRLRVDAYFENETYQTDRIDVKSFEVDNEEFVNLVGVRTVVTQGLSRILLDLQKDDFKIKENGVQRDIIHFKRDSAPLRVAILVDTSISMFGKKLYNAQYAVRTFLSKLQPEDRASIYTFDNKVMRIADFTNDFEELQRHVFTLSPQLATSLYDAILAANDRLEGQNGTKVIIILSDGSDSDSAVTDIHVATALRNSPVMVYSIILPGDFLGSSNDEGNRFLLEIARLSGSISTRVSKVKNLDKTFDDIYQELKSFYYFDYYSNILDPAKRELDVNVGRIGARARFRTLN